MAGSDDSTRGGDGQSRASHTGVSSYGSAYLVRADVRGTLPLADGSVQCCITSPPYFGLRDYNDPRQIGLEATPEAYVARMVAVFREVRRVLRDDGIVWLNIGDSYASGEVGRVDGGREGRLLGQEQKPRKERRITQLTGLPPKQLLGVPWRVAFALQADGWYLRSDTIWHKRSPMPESVTDRPTKAHEYIFLLSKRPNYFYDAAAEKVPAVTAGQVNLGFQSDRAIAMGRSPSGNELSGGKDKVRGDSANLRSVWTLSSYSFPGAHFATFPPELPARCIRLGTSERGACPACGSPYRRVLAKDRQPTRPGLESKILKSAIHRGDIDPEINWRNSTLNYGNRDPGRHVTTSSTVGWEPGCFCNAGDPIPCVVLDIFSGSGTTAAVARELGRVGIGLEVNADYLELARDRVRKPAIGRCNPSLEGPRPVTPMTNQMSLLD